MYKRSTNNEFNIHLAKHLRNHESAQPERKLTNAEQAQARVDAWLNDKEAQANFVAAFNKELERWKNPSTAWLWWRIVREFLTQCWETCWEFITRRAEAVIRLAKRIR
jgi:hypothetical protein